MAHHLIAPYVLVILREDDKILLVQRSHDASFAPGAYSLVGGSVEKNENFRQALVREIAEEIGVEVREEDLTFVHVFYRHGEVDELVATIFECSNWRGEPINKEPNKHHQLVWVRADELPDELLPAHRGALECIEQGMTYSEQA
jgi:8-oxo-dGTP diphosphatase